VDLPGHGWSSATPPTMVTLDDVAQGLCEALAPLRQSPAVLVGMSLGGALRPRTRTTDAVVVVAPGIA
jgi:pimeloyl-ACP methyl ester carboxylesterase